MHRRLRRLFRFYLKLVRHPGTPESLGRGVAAGLFVSFPLPAGHMLAAFPLAMLVRGARGAALLATWAVNPLTVSVVYPAQCYLGSFIIGDLLSYTEIKQLVAEFIADPSWSSICTLGGELIVAFFVGGLLMGGLAAVIGYFLTTAMARRYRIRRAERKKESVFKDMADARD